MITEEDIRCASATDLALALGVGRNTIANWSYGKGNVSAGVLLRAQRLGISADTLLSGIEMRRQDMALRERARQLLGGLMEASDNAAG